MIMAIDYDFLSYVIFDQHLKITFRKSSTPPPPKKSTAPFLLTLPLKIQKVQSPLPFANIENFSALPPAKRGGGPCDNTQSVNV